MNQDSSPPAARFFSEIASHFSCSTQARIGVLTHLLPDRPTFLQALGQLGNVEWVVPIKYSEWPGVADQVANLGIEVRKSPTESWPPPPNWFENLLNETVERRDHPLVLYEIGGYFASAIAGCSRRWPDRLLGVVEDTEAGHRIYSQHAPLPVPIYSVARSPLKGPEDVLVGESIVFSIEAVLRAMDRPLRGIAATVLGYGSVGSATARALASRGAHVTVWDINPNKRIDALAAGFSTPGREDALRQAELIVGAAGSASLNQSDLNFLRAGCILASGSSRQTEFAIELGQRRVVTRSPFGVPFIEALRIGDSKEIYLAYSGFPVNFANAASIGPFLQLAQGEILAAISHLINRDASPGLCELSEQARIAIAERWIAFYIDAQRGRLDFHS